MSNADKALNAKTEEISNGMPQLTPPSSPAPIRDANTALTTRLFVVVCLVLSFLALLLTTTSGSTGSRASFRLSLSSCEGSVTIPGSAELVDLGDDWRSRWAIREF